MTVPVQIPYTASIANGATTVFPFGFKIAAAEDLAVTVDGVLLTSGYTISGVGNQSGGSVTIAVAPSNGSKVVRFLAPVMKRDTDYQQFGDWTAEVVNLDFDRIWRALQTLQQNDIRSLKLPVDTAFDQVLTHDAAARANRTIKFDDEGNLTISTHDPDGAQESAESSAASAEASATVAVDSASEASSFASNAASSAASAEASAAAAAAAVEAVEIPLPIASGGTGETSAAAARTALGIASDGLFCKADPTTVAFTKTASSTLSIKAGTKIEVSGSLLSFATATAVVMPTLTAGSDYAIYACTDGTIRADANWSAPTGYTTANSRKIGGFHYGLVAPGTTPAGGSFNTSGSPVGGGMVWTQTDVDNIAGINKFSLWDLKFRPACSDPRGMVLVNGRTWVDIYLCSTDTATNGTSKYNTNIASGTVLPKVPVAFGGNGTLAYSTLDWWVASELARANQKRLMLASEFYDAAFGVTESQSIDATASTYPTTTRNAGYTSKWGIEQAAGVHYTWGQDSAGSSSAWTANGGRGQSYNSSVYRVLLGGSRTYGSNSGSRCSNWNYVPSYSLWVLGLRAACDHVQLV